MLRLHPRLAPVKAAVLPLVRKDGQPELAREVHGAVRDRGCRPSTTRRRDRQALSPPGRDRHAVLPDDRPPELEDRTVTLRERDSLAQERLPIEGLAEEIERRVNAPWRTPKLPHPQADTDIGETWTST